MPMAMKCVGVSALGHFRLAPLPHEEAEGPGQRGLQGGDVHLAVTLAGVPVADLEERARDVDRDEQRGARDEFLVIEVAGVHARRGAVHPARGLRRGDAHAAEERAERDLDPLGEAGDSSSPRRAG